MVYSIANGSRKWNTTSLPAKFLFIVPLNCLPHCFAERWTCTCWVSIHITLWGSGTLQYPSLFIPRGSGGVEFQYVTALSFACFFWSLDSYLSDITINFSGQIFCEHIVKWTFKLWNYNKASCTVKKPPRQQPETNTHTQQLSKWVHRLQ